MYQATAGEGTSSIPCNWKLHNADDAPTTTSTISKHHPAPPPKDQSHLARKTTTRPKASPALSAVSDHHPSLDDHDLGGNVLHMRYPTVRRQWTSLTTPPMAAASSKARRITEEHFPPAGPSIDSGAKTNQGTSDTRAAYGSPVKRGLSADFDDGVGGGGASNGRDDESAYDVHRDHYGQPVPTRWIGQCSGCLDTDDVGGDASGVDMGFSVLGRKRRLDLLPSVPHSSNRVPPDFRDEGLLPVKSEQKESPKLVGDCSPRHREQHHRPQEQEQEQEQEHQHHHEQQQQLKKHDSRWSLSLDDRSADLHHRIFSPVQWSPSFSFPTNSHSDQSQSMLGTLSTGHQQQQQQVLGVLTTCPLVSYADGMNGGTHSGTDMPSFLRSGMGDLLRDGSKTYADNSADTSFLENIVVNNRQELDLTDLPCPTGGSRVVGTQAGANHDYNYHQHHHHHHHYHHHHHHNHDHTPDSMQGNGRELSKTQEAIQREDLAGCSTHVSAATTPSRRFLGGEFESGRCGSSTKSGSWVLSHLGQRTLYLPSSPPPLPPLPSTPPPHEHALGESSWIPPLPSSVMLSCGESPSYDGFPRGSPLSVPSLSEMIF